MEKDKMPKKRSRPKKAVKKELPEKKPKKLTKEIKPRTRVSSKQTKPSKVEAKPKPEKYFEGLGRRKTVIARVRLFPQKEKSLSKTTSVSSSVAEVSTEAEKKKSSLASLPEVRVQFLVNEKSLEKYFPTTELQQVVFAPLNLMNCFSRFRVSVKVKGGGLVSQAEAVRHGIARALVLFNSDFRKKLKKAGYLKRDPRMRERKKFGLKRARRAPQWSKR